MLRVYRGWTVTPLNSKNLIAEKDGRAITGEWEEIVPKIDTYEYEQARKERANDTEEGNIDPESRN